MKYIRSRFELFVTLNHSLRQRCLQVFVNDISLTLLTKLKAAGIAAAGLLRHDSSVDSCPLKSEKKLRGEGRGSLDFRTSSDGLLVVKWFDSKEITAVASNHYSVAPVSQVKRWDKRKKKHITIPCPSLVSAFNIGMGGVDRCSQLLGVYR